MTDKLFFTNNGIRQNFDFSYSIVSYICKNPLPSTKFLHKLYSTCKFFYPKMRIIPCKDITLSGYPRFKSYLCSPLIRYICPLFKEKDYYRIDFPLKNIYLVDFKILCDSSTVSIGCIPEEQNNPRMLANFFTNFFWYCKNCYFDIHHQILSQNEYEKLADVSLSLSLYNVTITNLQGEIIPVEDLLNIGINIKNFSFSSYTLHKSYYTKLTFQKIAAVLRPKKFVWWTFGNVSAENFDHSAILTFIKKSAQIPESHICVDFNPNVPYETCITFLRHLKADLKKDKKLKNLKLDGCRIGSKKENFINIYSGGSQL